MDDRLTWVLLLIAVVALLGWYLSYSAARLDRLHHRVESAQAALDAQLVRRAAAAVEAAQVLDPSLGLLITDAAVEAMSAGEACAGMDGEQDGSLAVDAGREEAENALSRALLAAFGHPDELVGPRTEPLAAEALDVLGQACVRVQLARRFHNDAVAHAQRVRRKRVVRWARLAGRAAMPAMFEIDDTVPAGLSR